AVGAHPVSAATMSCLANVQACANAAQGDPAACDQALGQSVEHFTNIGSGHESMSGFLDETMFAGKQGRAHHELAVAGRDPHAAGRAVALLRQAVDGFGSDFARPRAQDLTRLAGAHAIAGDVDTAVTVGHQAVEAVTALSSPRAQDRLRVLNAALKPLH